MDNTKELAEKDFQALLAKYPTLEISVGFNLSFKEKMPVEVEVVTPAEETPAETPTVDPIISQPE